MSLARDRNQAFLIFRPDVELFDRSLDGADLVRRVYQADEGGRRSSEAADLPRALTTHAANIGGAAGRTTLTPDLWNASTALGETDAHEVLAAFLAVAQGKPGPHNSELPENPIVILCDPIFRPRLGG
jgi:hypothetical protein